MLSDEAITMITKLENILDEKRRVQEKIQLLESKLQMAREASLELVKSESEMVEALRAQNLYYGVAPPPQPVAAPAQQATGASQNQLTSLLNALLAQQSNVPAQPQLPVQTSQTLSVLDPVPVQPPQPQQHTSLIDPVSVQPPQPLSVLDAPFNPNDSSVITLIPQQTSPVSGIQNIPNNN